VADAWLIYSLVLPSWVERLILPRALLSCPRDWFNLIGKLSGLSIYTNEAKSEIECHNAKQKAEIRQCRVG
jgi:hypothetical protein